MPTLFLASVENHKPLLQADIIPGEAIDLTYPAHGILNG
jgi:hypothetical protein